MHKLSDSELKEFLDLKVLQYNRPEFITDDPIFIPHQFKLKEDIEISAFLTAVISWGNRQTILKSANKLMTLMDQSPAQFIMESGARDLDHLASFVHRTFNSEDCIFFISLIKRLYQDHGGLEKVFSQPVLQGLTIKESIIHFRKVFLQPLHPKRLEKHIADPGKNSSAKRINMFLRWMVRKDKNGVDFGIWRNLSPSCLYCPLDIHTGNVARKLGLIDRSANDWKTVELLTDRLRCFDPEDPVKYDFALFGLGIYEKF